MGHRSRRWSPLEQQSIIFILKVYCIHLALTHRLVSQQFSICSWQSNCNHFSPAGNTHPNRGSDYFFAGSVSEISFPKVKWLIYRYLPNSSLLCFGISVLIFGCRLVTGSLFWSFTKPIWHGFLKYNVRESNPLPAILWVNLKAS